MRILQVTSAYARNQSLMQLIDTMPWSFDNGGVLLWNGRNKIKSFCLSTEGNSVEVVVKRFKHLSLIQKVVYAIRKHKARKAYYNALELVRRGVRTPAPVAFIEQRNGLWLTDAYYISEATSLRSIESEVDRDDWNRKLATAFGQFVATLHSNGVLHHDLNDTNVLYDTDSAGNYRFEVIDINRMKFYDCGNDIPQKECIENLTRFTGRIDLFEYVIRAYAAARNIKDIEAFAKSAVAQKRLHDLKWRRRKRFSKLFKHKK